MPARGGQIDALQHLQIAIGFVQIADLDHRRAVVRCLHCDHGLSVGKRADRQFARILWPIATLFLPVSAKRLRKLISSYAQSGQAALAWAPQDRLRPECTQAADAQQHRGLAGQSAAIAAGNGVKHCAR